MVTLGLSASVDRITRPGQVITIDDRERLEMRVFEHTVDQAVAVPKADRLKRQW